MNRVKLLGLLGMTDDGEFIFVPMRGVPKLSIMTDVSGVNVEGIPVDDLPGIVEVPSPDEERTIEEQSKDYSLDGRLNAAKKRGKEEEGGGK